jgi:hypothetical protein
MSDLVTRDFVSTALGAGDDLQWQIDLLIDWVSERAESIIGRELMSEERTEYLDGSWSSSIILPVIPVTSVSGVYLDSDHEFGSDTEVESSDYYLNTKTGIIYLYDDLTPKGVATVKVVFTGGYTTDNLPADLKMACLEAISWNFSRMRDKQYGVKNETTPDGITRGYEMVLPMAAQRVFDAYREVRI